MRTKLPLCLCAVIAALAFSSVLAVRAADQPDQAIPAIVGTTQ